MMKRLMVVLMVVVLMLTGCNSRPDNTCSLASCEIGWNQPIETEGNYQQYKLMTPRGIEIVAGTTNLNKSIDEYIKADVFGKKVSELNERQLKKFRVKI